MPPTKLLKVDPSQGRLTSFMQSSPNTDKNQTDVDANNNETGKKLVKQRTFQSKWLTLYSWLRYEPGHENVDDYMYCALCTDNKKMNGMCKIVKNRNYQNTTLTRHANLPDHKLCIEAPLLRENLVQCQAKAESNQDKAMKVLLKAIHWICSENLPISKFKSLVDLLHDVNVPDIAILRHGSFGYDSEFTASEMLDSLATVTEEELDSQLTKSPVVTVLSDESTDLANTKRLVIYAQIITEDFRPSTIYVNNIECKDTTGKGIAKSLMTEFSQRGVSSQKIMSMGSDGASVMTGKYNGVAAIMKHDNPHMVNIHCVAHRLALCTSQAAAGIPMLQKHQQILTDLFYYFKGSSKRETRLHEIQEVLDDPVLTIKEIHSVRWLSYFIALTSVYRTMDSLLTYLAELHSIGKDPKASGLRKKMASDTFISTTYMLMDAMAPVTILSQFFQTENVDVALVKVKIDLCMADLKKVKALQSPYCKQLEADLQTNKFKGQHEITKSNFNLQNLTDTFIDALMENIMTRFPETDILSAFSVLGMRPITFLSTQELEEYGEGEIDTLCNFYGHSQTVKWKDEDKVDHENTSDAVLNAGETKREWKLLKQVVKAEQYPRESLWKLWNLISVYHSSDFPNLLVLGRLALTSAVHTAGCERGFSVQNQVLTKSRNRLTVEKQNKLMRVKLCSFQRSQFADNALPVLKLNKNRRLYQQKNVQT